MLVGSLNHGVCGHVECTDSEKLGLGPPSRSFEAIHSEVSTWTASGYFMSQGEEDKWLLEHLFAHRMTPAALSRGDRKLFVELGALNGRKYSNTFFFEKAFGWKGVLIEAELVNFRHLQETVNKFRNRSHAVHAAACREPQLIQVQGHRSMTKISAIGRTVPINAAGPRSNFSSTVLCIPMRTILAAATQNQNHIQGIELYSIDVEGNELDVVLSHDWAMFPARVVLIEMAKGGDANKENAALITALRSAGMCRHTIGVGHRNDVWVDPKYDAKLRAV